MKIEITGEVTTDPRELTRSIAEVIEAICRSTGLDPAEGIALALAAAAKIALAHSDKVGDVMLLAEALGSSTVAAEHWFGTQPVSERLDG